MKPKESELVLNNDGSVYHLALHGNEIADKVILVGDPGRVELVGEFLDSIRFIWQNREFHSLTGTFEGKEITVLSTGIGTDNIDIVMNELDAAVNFDPISREEKPVKRSLQIVRIGTCGSLQEDTPCDTFIASTYGIGLDGVAHFYDIRFSEKEKELAEAFATQCQWPSHWNTPYCSSADEILLNKIGFDMAKGATVTANGFYGPQGRALRIPLGIAEMNDRISAFSYDETCCLNYEMETAALYALGRALAHRCATVCTVVANRKAGTFSKDYKDSVKKLIRIVLERV